MNTKPYPVFGFVLSRTEIPAGAVVNDGVLFDNVMTVLENNGALGTTVSRGRHIWIIVEGYRTATNLQTGEVSVQHAGWSNIDDPLPIGKHQIAFPENSVHVCLAEEANLGKVPRLPTVKILRLQQGELYPLAIGDRLYLLNGSLTIGDTTFAPMKQIFVTTSKSAKAETDCLGFLIY